MPPDYDLDNWEGRSTLTNLIGVYIGTGSYGFSADSADYGKSNDEYWVGVNYTDVSNSADRPSSCRASGIPAPSGRSPQQRQIHRDRGARHRATG